MSTNSMAATNKHARVNQLTENLQYANTTVADHAQSLTYKVCAGDAHLGSSFKFDATHLLTCAHVVAPHDGSAQLYVSNRGSTWTVQILHVNTARDVAVLKFTQTPPQSCTTMSEGFMRGTTVYGAGYVGSPDGRRCSAEFTITKGMLSSNPTGPVDQAYWKHTASIFADAGMSGGPVLDRQGRLLGMLHGSLVARNVIRTRYLPFHLLLSVLAPWNLSL